MDRNTIIGWSLIFLIFMAWVYVNSPTPEELEAQQRTKDSLEQLANQAIVDPVDTTINRSMPTTVDSSSQVVKDSMTQMAHSQSFGVFAAAASGQEQETTLENDLFKITFTNKGGAIKEVELKEYFEIVDGEGDRKEEKKVPLKLMNDEKNQFDYLLPLNNNSSNTIKSSALYFSAQANDKEVVFRADAGNGRYFEQKYAIEPGKYQIDYQVKMEGFDGLVPKGQEFIELNWVHFLNKLEINTNYERNYSSVYFKAADDGVSYCNCQSDDEDDANNDPIKWVSHANQFFNTTLLADQTFKNGVFETIMLPNEDQDLKKLRTHLKLPFNHKSSQLVDMTFYVGPNEFERLAEMGHNVYEVIPFGSSILGTINRWVIRPVFSFLSGFIGNKGIVILVLTLLVKLALYPLTYRMLYSQSKMGALKPQLESMRGKFKDDPQKQQMEQMKLYRENGVNPLGGCMPMVLQMPIWIALYRFFPASIEFRQASFLWATDLSSYDVFFRLPLELPFNMGSHISLFTVLWALTTLVYTYYNTRHMDMSANPAMKYMQYLMPLFFLGFFNSFASGLTCYLLFSNLMNITQTIVTKNLIIDQEKIKRDLANYRAKPKKKGGFSARLEKALKEQQRIQAEKETSTKKKRKK